MPHRNLKKRSLKSRHKDHLVVLRDPLYDNPPAPSFSAAVVQLIAHIFGGAIQCRMQCVHAGDWIRVAVALEKDHASNWIAVLTVF